MFLEPHFERYPQGKATRTGWIEVISGSMFSGKTEELIRRLNRAKIARLTERRVQGSTVTVVTLKND